jgi:hypothetical protein
MDDPRNGPTERNVIFGAEQIWWNCQTLWRAEDTVYCQNSLLLLNGAYLNVAYHTTRRTLCSDGTTRLRPIPALSKCARDRVRGLSNTVEHILQHIQTNYYVGFWQSSFIRSLLHRTRSIGPASDLRTSSYIAPSWSWAFIKNPVSYNLGLVEGSHTPVGTELLYIQCIKFK